PESVEVHLIDRPGQPYLGTGESAQGPTAAAIGNALADATGARMRELPLTRARIKAAVGVGLGSSLPALGGSFRRPSLEAPGSLSAGSPGLSCLYQTEAV